MKTYEIKRSDGRDKKIEMPKGSMVQHYCPGIPDGTVFVVQRIGGSLKRYYVAAAGLYVKITSGQFADAWMKATGPIGKKANADG